MIESIKQKATEHGIKLAVLPMDCILDVKDDMEKLVKSNLLNRRLKWIEEERYLFKNHTFQPKSILVALWKLNLAELIVNHKGKKKSCIVSDIYYPTTDKQNILKELFSKYGYSLDYIYWIPHKNFAVHSGLCEYGRNNLTYNDEYGSFIRIEVFITDAPAEDYMWREMVNMPIFDTYEKCMNSCPTKVILPDKFLIDSKFCISYLTCEESEMPDWVSKPVPFRLVECLYCQDICPINQHRLKNLDRIEFGEIETEIMLNSASYADFPDNIKNRFWHYNYGEAYEFIPRNLKLLLEKD